MKADAKTENEVRAVVEACFKAYSENDYDRALGFVAPDADVVFFGTNEDEKMIGKQQVEDQFKLYLSQVESLSINPRWMSVSAAGPVAWVALDCFCEVVADGNKVQFPCRVTMVLEKRINEWLIVQSHTSVPASNPV